MGIFGFRLDVFVICWFIGMGMVNTLDAATGIFNKQVTPQYSVSQISNWTGIQVGHENETGTSFNSLDNLPDLLAAIPGMLFNMVTYTFKAGIFVLGVLWNATFGLNTYLYNNFDVPYIWGNPIMILINLVNFMGLIELWTKVKM